MSNTYIIAIHTTMGLTFSSSCMRRWLRSRNLLDDPPVLNKADRLERSTGAHSAVYRWEKMYIWLEECVTMANDVVYLTFTFLPQNQVNRW